MSQPQFFTIIIGDNNINHSPNTVPSLTTLAMINSKPLTKSQALALESLVLSHPDFTGEMLERDRATILATIEKLKEVAG